MVFGFRGFGFRGFGGLLKMMGSFLFAAVDLATFRGCLEHSWYGFGSSYPCGKDDGGEDKDGVICPQVRVMPGHAVDGQYAA